MAEINERLDREAIETVENAENGQTVEKPKKGKSIAVIIVAIFLIGAIAGGIGTVAVLQNIGKTALVDRAYLNEVTGIAAKYAKLEAFYRAIETDYYGEYTDEELMEGIYDGLFSKLDKYSCYMTAEEYKANTESTMKTFSGVGVVMSVTDDDKVIIISVYRGTPAEKAGLKAGDILLEIDGKTYAGSQLENASNALRGEKGTKVKVKYLRGSKEKEVVMVRDTINNETIYTGTVLENLSDGHKIEYIGIESFGSGTGTEMEDILHGMEMDGTEAFILDLRNNPGGVVESACKVADLLLKEGVVMTTKTKQGSEDTVVSDSTATSLPFVVLVNQNSASAAEIVAAAIKGNKAAKIIGMPTFGKGVVQYIREINGGGGDAIKLTFEEYFGPNDLKINDIGVKPDITVDLTSDDKEDVQLARAIEEILKEL